MIFLPVNKETQILYYAQLLTLYRYIFKGTLSDTVVYTIVPFSRIAADVANSAVATYWKAFFPARS